jgi:hypothetical protein
MDGRAKPGHDGGGQSMRELKRLLFRGSLASRDSRLSASPAISNWRSTADRNIRSAA